MTSKKDGRGIPRGWKYVPVFSRKGYYRHDGYALNRCQWIKHAIWTVATDEKQQTATIRCYWAYYVDSGKGYHLGTATLTIAGETLSVEKGPWRIQPRAGENPLLAGIRWVQQQENAAKQYGSR